jgi:predicted dehydrogenase
MNQILPESIAIAGAWGYIGRKFLQAAADLGLKTYVLDPGPRPDDVDPASISIIEDPADFYALDADLFHLALHPDAREYPLSALFQRSRRERAPVILCEKPMATPGNPAFCNWVISESRVTSAALFFDFPELFDPMTLRIHEFLASFEKVQFEEIHLTRSKDREDPANPRNYKIMVPIQYQETVHCIAYALCLLAIGQKTDLNDICSSVRAEATSLPYCPPNPEIYMGPVDGFVEGQLTFGTTTVGFHTNFKARAPWSKRRVIRGIGDGKPFFIEADYLEGAKYLRINGEDQGFAATLDSYATVIRQIASWRATLSNTTLMSGMYPNAPLAGFAYFLSHFLWECCSRNSPVESSIECDGTRLVAKAY